MFDADDVVDTDDFVDGDYVVDDDDNVDDVLVMVINLKHKQMPSSNHLSPLLPSSSPSLIKLSHIYQISNLPEQG